jgi:hypothetical protein
MKVIVTRSIGGGFALERTDNGMVKFKRSMSLFLREGDLLLFFQGLQEKLP